MTHSPLYAPQNHPVPTARRKQPAGYSKKPRAQSSQRLAWFLSTLALTTLAIVPKDLWPQLSISMSAKPNQQQATQSWSINREETETCQSVLNAEQRLSRDQLSQLLSIPQDSSQASVHETIAPPYCTLSKVKQSNQREAYPLAFDPDTWLVVNYDQSIYQGYDFIFKK
ncbi:MAG: hypothetical protein F6K11_25540 [Leptolyngbya sp. SIO3F4]|nr:hypothetical protein [Leptolyngbya sp. SIO3F4]